MPLRLTLIAAVSDDGYISAGKGIPWHLPDDVAHFRAFTEGKHLLVGGSTYDEMTGWFRPQHTVHVLGKPRSPAAPKVRFYPDLGTLLQTAGREIDAIIVIGGSSIYEQTIQAASQLVITHVHTQLGQGKPFPDIRESDWTVVRQQHHPADSRHALPFSIVTYNTSVLRG
ncbi:MAG: dihydrofolate reductase [Verrucomicrobiaceae bacterium]|nr:dihydrofolate reductase [Verrucomicrobiaceae bacterium]